MKLPFSQRSLSLVHILAVVIMLSVSVWNFAVYYVSIRGKTQEQIELQRTKIEMALNYLPKFLNGGYDDLAMDFLEMGKATNYFDFYVLKRGGQPVSNSANLTNLDTSNIPEGALHQELKNPGLVYYVSKKTFGPYELTLGYFPVNPFFTKRNIAALIKANILDTIVFFAAIVLLGMRGFFRQTKLIFDGQRDELEKFSPATKEGKLIKNLFMHASEFTRRLVEWHIPDGVEVELSKGTMPGSTFRAGMIRIDLNNYTELTNKYGPGVVDSLLSPIFSEFRELAQRYGYFEVADGGDERVFYSRSADAVDSRNRALSAIRGMFDIGKRASPIFEEKFSILLNFKAAYAVGSLFLKEEDGKRKIKGEAYTYSQRYIETFKTRPQKDYLVVMAASEHDSADPLIDASVSENHNLKGLGENKLTYITQLASKPFSKSQVKYFLSNSEITANFKSLIVAWNPDMFFATMESFVHFKSLIKEPGHGNLICQLLEARAKVNDDPRVSASLLTALSKLSRAKDLSPESIAILLAHLQSDHDRLKANALACLGELGIYTEKSREFLLSKNNRVRGNALVIAGQNDIGEEILRNLKGLLESPYELEVVTGLYVVDQLFDFHVNNDLTVFRTAKFFTEVFGVVEALTKKDSRKIKQRSDLIYSDYVSHFADNS